MCIRTTVETRTKIISVQVDGSGPSKKFRTVDRVNRGDHVLVRLPSGFHTGKVDYVINAKDYGPTTEYYPWIVQVVNFGRYDELMRDEYEHGMTPARRVIPEPTIPAYTRKLI